MDFVPFVGLAIGAFSLGSTVKDMIMEKPAEAAELLRKTASVKFEGVRDPEREHSLQTYTYLSPAWCNKCKCLLYGVINQVCILILFIIRLVNIISLQGLYCSLCGMNFHDTSNCRPTNNCSCLMPSQVNPLFDTENKSWRKQMEEKKFIGLVNETSKSVQFQSSRSLRTRTQVFNT